MKGKLSQRVDKHDFGGLFFNRNSEPRWRNKSLMIYDGATTTNIYQKMGRGGNLTHIA